jgi:hypothetical protein
MPWPAQNDYRAHCAVDRSRLAGASRPGHIG